MAFKDLRAELAELFDQEHLLEDAEAKRGTSHRRHTNEQLKARRADAVLDDRLRRKRVRTANTRKLAALPKPPREVCTPARWTIECTLCRRGYNSPDGLVGHWRAEHPAEHQAAARANKQAAARARKLDRRAAPPRLEPVRVGKGALSKVAYYRRVG